MATFAWVISFSTVSKELIFRPETDFGRSCFLTCTTRVAINLVWFWSPWLRSIFYFIYVFTERVTTQFQRHIMTNLTCKLLQWVSRIGDWFQFELCRLELISTTAPAALYNDAWFKSGQNWLKKKSICFVNLNPWHTLCQQLFWRHTGQKNIILLLAIFR